MGKTNEINENSSLFHLAWPIFVECFLAILIGNVDSLMLSQYSDTAVGSVGNANQILNLLTLAFSVISSATGVIVAQYLGAKLKEKINEIYTVAIVFNLFISIVISVIIALFAPLMFQAMHVSKEMMPDAIRYMRLLGGFIFLQACFNIFTQIFRCNGLTKIGMYISLFINVLNIIGNYIFLYGPLKGWNLGVTGVAISSVVSRVIAMIAVIWCFVKYIDGKMSVKYLKPFPFKTLKKMVMLGVPTAGESISYSISQILLMTFVNMLGNVAVNAKIFASLLANFSYVYSVSVGQSTQIIVGHLVGAGKEEAAYRRVLRTLRSAVVISVGIAAVNYLVSPFSLTLFVNDKATLKLASECLLIGILLELGRSANLVIITSMRSAGDIKFPTYLGIASMWGVSVVLGYLLGITLGFGLHGIWFAMAMDEVIRAIVVYIRWKRGGWRGKSLVKEEEAA